MVGRFRFFKVLAFSVMLFLCFELGFNTLVSGYEVSRIKFLYSPIKVEADGRIYKLGYVREGNEKYLVALDLKGKIVEDSKVLEKIFFVEYVYRPVFDKPKEFNGPVEIGGYRKLDEYRLMQQLADVTLFVREAGSRALVQAGKIYITGGSSAGEAVGEKIAEKTAEHLIESILANPTTYLKGTVSLVFEDSASRWKRAETLFLKTKGNNLLRYEDAERIHNDLSYGRAYGIESMMFLARLTLQDGGGGDLLSQLQKIGEYAWDEFVSEVKGLYRQKSLVTATMLSYKLETFLLSKVPIYKQYVENTRSFYKQLHDYKESEYWKNISKTQMERNIKLAKSHGKESVTAIFADNFENYAIGSPPPSPWTNLSGGPGIVTKEKFYSGSKSIVVSGGPYSARSSVIDLGTNYTDLIQYQGYVYFENSHGIIGFHEQFMNQAPSFNAIRFQRNREVYFESADRNTGFKVLLRRDLSYGWHHIKVQLDFQALRARVWLDGFLVGNSLPISPKNVTYGNYGSGPLRHIGLIHHADAPIYLDDFSLSSWTDVPLKKEASSLSKQRSEINHMKGWKTYQSERFRIRISYPDSYIIINSHENRRPEKSSLMLCRKVEYDKGLETDPITVPGDPPPFIMLGVAKNRK